MSVVKRAEDGGNITFEADRVSINISQLATIIRLSLGICTANSAYQLSVAPYLSLNYNVIYDLGKIFVFIKVHCFSVALTFQGVASEKVILDRFNKDI